MKVKLKYTYKRMRFKASMELVAERPGILSVGPLAEEYHGQRLCENLYVEENGLVFSIVEIKEDHFTKAEFAAARDLPETGHARFCSCALAEIPAK